MFGTRVAETILASVHVRAHQQAGHMDASDLIKHCLKTLARRGPSTYTGDRHAKLLIHVAMEGRIASSRMLPEN